MKAKGDTLDTGSLTFYYVARIAEENGNYSYAFTEDYASCGLSLQDPHFPDLAMGLE